MRAEDAIAFISAAAHLSGVPDPRSPDYLTGFDDALDVAAAAPEFAMALREALVVPFAEMRECSVDAERERRAKHVRYLTEALERLNALVGEVPA